MKNEQHLTFRTRIAIDAARAFAWHTRAGAFERLSPPWDDVRIVERTGTIHNGDRAVLSIPVLGPLRKKWVAVHGDFIEGKQFRDVQEKGPFAAWEHTHLFENDPADANAFFMTDDLKFALPMGAIGAALGSKFVRSQLQKMFTYRHWILQHDLRDLSEFKQPMRIAISGANGLIGKNLQPLLTTQGHTVLRLARGKIKKTSQGNSEIPWDPATGLTDPQKAEGLDGVIHLAGESIVGRWTDAKKASITASRVPATRALCESLAKLKQPPKVLICASAIGFYGERGDEWLDENATPGKNFLAEIAQQWVAATQPARDCGIRVVTIRLGIVLSPQGGALAKMLPAFKLGGGGILGSGEHFWSWISLEDVLGAIHHILRHDAISGPVNLVSPQPVTNRQFTKTLGSVLHRPTIFAVPAFALRLAFGQMADECLLSSQRVDPGVLRKTGYVFRDPTLKESLQRMLGR